MATCDHLDWPDSPEFNALLRILLACWPSTITLTLETIGLDGQRGSSQGFLRAMQALTDDGFVQYEALVVGATRGPEAIDATLTARGRAFFGSRSAPQACRTCREAATRSSNASMITSAS